MGYIKYAENKENKKTEESIKYEDIYESPIGKIFISCNETGLTEVSFVKEDILADRKNTANAENIESIKKNISILTDTKRWLDIYFSGKEPGFVPSFHVSGTPFQLGSAQREGDRGERAPAWCMENTAKNPICKDSDLWGNCKGDCKRKRNITYVRTGSRRCCGE